jgi:hypothetical protein
VKPLTFLFCLLLVPALACSTTSIAESLVPSGGVLYQDYFGSDNSGWGAVETKAGTAGYIDGAYHVVLNQPNVNVWSHPGKQLSTVRVEVSVMPASGPNANRMGLVCRLKDDENFYFFVVSADGYFGIGKVKAGQANLLNGSEMEQNNAILTGNQINRVRADCIGNVLSLYVNNLPVATVKDDEFTGGDVGILAGSFNQPGSDVYFDNFIVYKP